jgi:hypothetical protein
MTREINGLGTEKPARCGFETKQAKNAKFAML